MFGIEGVGSKVEENVKLILLQLISLHYYFREFLLPRSKVNLSAKQLRKYGEWEEIGWEEPWTVPDFKERKDNFTFNNDIEEWKSGKVITCSNGASITIQHLLALVLFLNLELRTIIIIIIIIIIYYYHYYYIWLLT